MVETRIGAPVNATREMAEAATAFIAALGADQRAQACFAFGDHERLNWDSGPRQRKGLPLGAMAPEQRHLAIALLATALSRRGLVKALTIMSLEKVLWELEGHSPRRDPERYYLCVFGVPEAECWAWRFEGHHCSVNLTIDGAHLFAGPAFRAANPAQVTQGPRAGLRVLGDEEDAGRALFEALDDGQRRRALLRIQPPRDTVTGTARQVTDLEPAGLSAAAMDARQRELLGTLLDTWSGHFREELAEQAWRRAEDAGLERLHFAWAGDARRGEPHYYRVHGPTTLIEFSNVQNHGNHVHAVWREPGYDFGGMPGL